MEGDVRMLHDVNPNDIDEATIESVKVVAARAFAPTFMANQGEYELALSIAKVTSFEDTFLDDEFGFKATVMIDGQTLTVTVAMEGENL
jgi:hypothetical protein